MVKGLAGRRILVTRPQAQAASLSDAIRARGGEPLVFPLLAIAAVDNGGRAALDAVAARLDDFDLAFFVSPNAVAHGLAAMRARRAWPPHLRVATVGKGSEQALRDHGFDSAIAPQQGFDSEAVLALPEFQAEAVRDKRVLIFRGDGGRELLGDELVTRGALVEKVCCYQRSCPDADAGPVIALARDGALHAITLTSSEAVGNLRQLAGEGGMAVLCPLPVFVPHPRIARFAREAGFAHVLECAPGDDGLLAALESHLSASLG